jgi:pyruvate dehydrogenase E1 component
MGTHQQKKLDDEALREFRDRFAVPLSDEDVAQLRFLKPAADSAEMKYLHARRQALGGYLPARNTAAPKLKVPRLSGSERNQSTTMAFVQLLSALMKDETLGKRVVPIVADEARTFGMQTLFRQFGIYSSLGQLYEPEDSEELLFYREAKEGQILGKASPRPVRSRPGWPRRPLIRRTARRCCPSTSTTRSSASSASATLSGRRPIRAPEAS